MAKLIYRILWAYFIGSWLTPIWYLLGFILTALIITAPTGLWFFDRVGYIFSLYEDKEKEKMTFAKSAKSILWFLFIGWWLGFIVIALADLFLGLIVAAPLGWWLINRIDRVVILA